MTEDRKQQEQVGVEADKVIRARWNARNDEHRARTADILRRMGASREEVIHNGQAQTRR
jgi:hypothetical protein